MDKNSCLDQIKKISKIDKSSMLKTYLKTPDYCKDAVHRALQIKIPSEVQISASITIHYARPKHVIIVGMGGSAIGGEILRNWLRERTPVTIEVCKDYILPAYANKDTLVFVVSYSGNTEETVNAFLNGLKRGCSIVVITSGGILLSLAEKFQLLHVKIPSGMPSRAAFPYLFFPIPILMEKIGVLKATNREISEAIQVIESLSEELAPQVPTMNNESKTLALKLNETIPVVWGFRQYEAVAYRLKTQFNENSKLPSKSDIFPELNHNEVVGWEAPKELTKQFSILLIRDLDEPPEIKYRIETTKRLLLNKTRQVLEIYARGKKKLAKMLSILYIGDLTSIYSAILRNTDPTPIETIDKIKRKIRKYGTIENLKKEMQRL